MRRGKLAWLLILVLVLTPVMLPLGTARAQSGMGSLQQVIPDGFNVDDLGTLTSGKPVEGKVFPMGNEDAYTLSVKANQWITIEILGSNGLRPQVEVYYPNGSLFTEVHGELTATKQVQMIATGTYGVVVKSYPYPSATTGLYTLTVTIRDKKV